MPGLTLESLAARVTELEREVSALKAKPPSIIPPTRDWRSVVGISEETDFSRAMQAEMQAARDAERQAASGGGE
jgi:hypothetical protein